MLSRLAPSPLNEVALIIPVDGYTVNADPT